MSKNFNLTLLPLYRLSGNEQPSPPGLLALTPPRRKARSRANDVLIVHLMLAGNAEFSTANYLQMTSGAAKEFYNTSGSVTAALRAAATTLNGDLLERNMAASGQGRYTLATLILGVVHGEQIYFLESGPAHIYWMAGKERRDIYDADMAGRGLGLGQSVKFYLSQLPLRAAGRLLIAPELPAGWMPILQRDNQSASLETMRSVLLRQNMDDQNAVLIQIDAGKGDVKILKPPRPINPTLTSISKKIVEENPSQIESHQPEPAASTPTEKKTSIDNESKPPHARDSEILASLPRQKMEEPSAVEDEPNVEIPEEIEEDFPTEPPASEVIVRKSARVLARGMRATRQGNNKVKDFFIKMLPRVLPASDSETPVSLPSWVMALMAVIIPLVVVTIASVVYFNLGSSEEYKRTFSEAQVIYARASTQVDPVSERRAWEELVKKLDEVEEYDKTEDSQNLREEAQGRLDVLLGVIRLNFYSAVKNLPKDLAISAMVASDTELFMLNETTGEILRAYLIDRGYQYDPDFICRSGDYGGTSVKALVDLHTLPTANAMASTVLGIDGEGNLLYCAANQNPQAMSLRPPPIEIKEVTDIVLDSDALYLLDAPSREIWVYGGQAATFINYPTAFFEQAPQNMENAKDMSVKGTELYLLFSDGHLVNCTYSLLDTVPTRCIDPAQLVDPHPAAGGGNSFRQDLFSEMLISTPPDPALLLLAPDIQSVFRFSPRSFSLQNQLRPAAGIISGKRITAMASSPAHILFIAQGDDVYMVTDIR